MTIHRDRGKREAAEKEVREVEENRREMESRRLERRKREEEEREYHRRKEVVQKEKMQKQEETWRTKPKKMRRKREASLKIYEVSSMCYRSCLLLLIRSYRNPACSPIASFVERVYCFVAFQLSHKFLMKM